MQQNTSFIFIARLFLWMQVVWNADLSKLRLSLPWSFALVYLEPTVPHFQKMKRIRVNCQFSSIFIGTIFVFITGSDIFLNSW